MTFIYSTTTTCTKRVIESYRKRKRKNIKKKKLWDESKRRWFGRVESDVGEVGKEGEEEWDPRKSLKRYRWGQQRCLFPWVWNHVALTVSWAGGESGGKERAISFDSLLRFASHAHPSTHSLSSLPYQTFMHPTPQYHIFFYNQYPNITISYFNSYTSLWDYKGLMRSIVRFWNQTLLINFLKWVNDKCNIIFITSFLRMDASSIIKE